MLPDQAASPLEALELRQGEEEEFRASLQHLAALCRASGLGGATSSRLRPHEVLSVALREYSQRRGIRVDVASVGCAASERTVAEGETAAQEGIRRIEDHHAGTSREADEREERGGGPAVAGNGGCPSSRRRASSWGDLPCTVEANLFSRLRDEMSPHAARLVCRSWKAAVEQNLTHLTASPRGENGLGCLCYLRSFRSIEELKLYVEEEDFEREKVLVPDLLQIIRLQPRFRVLDMTQAEIHCSNSDIDGLADELGFRTKWPVNEMDQVASDPEDAPLLGGAGAAAELDHDWITDDDGGDDEDDDDDDDGEDDEDDDDDEPQPVLWRGVVPRQLSYDNMDGEDDEDDEDYGSSDDNGEGGLGAMEEDIMEQMLDDVVEDDEEDDESDEDGEEDDEGGNDY